MSYIMSTSKNIEYEYRNNDAEALKPLLETAVTLSKEAGELMIRYAKSCGNYEPEEHEANIAKIDAEIEEILIRGLLNAYPDHNFIGKHSVTKDGADCVLGNEPTWIVDSLGGTLNFNHGFQHSCISIGMTKNKEPVLGMIHNPMLEQIITAIRGGGAIYNDQPIQASSIKELKNALVSFDCDTTGDEKRDEIIIETLGNIMPSAHGIRNLGSAALNMAMVALGGFDACFGFDVRAWEVCAGAIIVIEAGGVVLAPTLSPFDLFSNEVLCTGTPELAVELSKNLMQFDSLKHVSVTSLKSLIPNVISQEKSTQNIHWISGKLSKCLSTDSPQIGVKSTQDLLHVSVEEKQESDSQENFINTSSQT